MNELQETIYLIIISIFKNDLLSKKSKKHEDNSGQKI